MITRRDAKITLDAAAGKTYAELAAEHGVNVARIGQIVTKTRGHVAMSGVAHTKEQLGNVLARRLERRSHDWRYDTPESFYWDELYWSRPVPSRYI